MKYKKSQEDKINTFRQSSKYCKAVIQKDILDMTYLNYKPESHIRKINQSSYIKIKRVEVEGKIEILSDGEVHDFMAEEGRNKRSLRKIYKDMRQLINTNFYNSNSKNQLFITLTYADNMQNPEQLHNDFRNFFKRLKRKFKEHELAYIAIIEPQARGAWHIHLLLKSDKGLDEDYATKRVIYDSWGHGLTYTERLGFCDNFGSYFAAYFSNVEIDENKAELYKLDESDIIVKNSKKYIKGNRLNFYPDYFQIYRHSKNIKKPCVVANDVSVTEDFPRVTYQSIVEIDIQSEHIEDIRTIKIATEQRKKK